MEVGGQAAQFSLIMLFVFFNTIFHLHNTTMNVKQSSVRQNDQSTARYTSNFIRLRGG